MKIIGCWYIPESNRLGVLFGTDHPLLEIPCSFLQEFEGCTPEDLRQIRFSPNEPSIQIEHKGIDINLLGLVINYLFDLKQELDPDELWPPPSKYWDNLLHGRDRFIVQKGLFGEFVAFLQGLPPGGG